MPRVLPSLLATALLVAAPAGTAYAAEDPLLEALQAVKSSVRGKRLDDAELALRHLAELAAAPERAAVKPKILPALHFYSSLVAFERRDEERARVSLRHFFELQPGATIDRGTYSKAFCTFFDAERTAFASHPPDPAAGAPPDVGGGVLPSYDRNDFDTNAIPANTGSAEWGETGIRFLMSDDEKKEWTRLSDDGARREFVERFWRRRDPDPGTEVNEFAVEFYRRVQYAERNFSTESTKGSLSERGMVFLILGPPSFVGRAVVRSGQDVMNVLRTTEVQIVPSPSGGAALMRVPSSRASITPGDNEGEMETWHYRRDRIPPGLPFTELEFQFLTQRGYGSGVLQKDARPLMALQRASSLLRH